MAKHHADEVCPAINPLTVLVPVVLLYDIGEYMPGYKAGDLGKKR